MNDIIKMNFRLLTLAGTLVSSSSVFAQTPSDTAGYAAADCPSCAEWNEPTDPVRLHGNTYYVGTRGLAALLIVSDSGHVLIDGGLPNSAPLIVRNIQKLGFRPRDIRLILNSHAHYDHAGGLAALQRMTGAVVAASKKSVDVIRNGRPGPDDPQYEIALPYAGVRRALAFEDNDTLRVGALTLVAHLTPGHTPGGTTWTWRSCAASECLDFVYADSQTPVSSDSFLFSRNDTYPSVLQDFEKGFATLERLSCHILVTPHPVASNLWQRLAGEGGAQLVDGGACKRYAASARATLARRLARERGQ